MTRSGGARWLRFTTSFLHRSPRPAACKCSDRWANFRPVKVLYQIPAVNTVYAAHFIYQGYRRAFLDLGHQFRPLSSEDSLRDVLEEYRPDIMITSLNRYCFKFLDPDLLAKYRKQGLVLFTQLQAWRYQTAQFGGGNLSAQSDLVALIKNGLAGDLFFHWVEQDDPSMDGFTKETGRPFETILLAADRLTYYPDADPQYAADIAYVGSYLPDKRAFLKAHVAPLRRRYDVKVYGSDWTLPNRVLGYAQKAGQYFNIRPLKGIRKLGLSQDDERKVYSTARISLNVHEEHQRKGGSDFNERTFKILACGGFEISDYVSQIRKYFREDELVMARNTKEWFELIDHYLKNPDERAALAAAGRKKVLEEHTYHHRAARFIALYHRHHGAPAENAARDAVVVDDVR